MNANITGVLTKRKGAKNSITEQLTLSSESSYEAKNNEEHTLRCYKRIWQRFGLELIQILCQSYKDKKWKTLHRSNRIRLYLSGWDSEAS